jgi:hypothetical protein
VTIGASDLVLECHERDIERLRKACQQAVRAQRRAPGERKRSGPRNEDQPRRGASMAHE